MAVSPDAIMKKYGLEFIKDNAKDRKIAIQTLGVTFKNATQTLSKSNIINRQSDRKYVDDLFKELHEKTNRTIETQLSRLTIKAFTWIKNVLVSSDILTITEEPQDKTLDKELQVMVENLQKRVKTQADELTRLQHTHKAVQDQFHGKEKTIQGLEQKLTAVKASFQQQLTTEKARGESLYNQITAMNQKMNTRSAELDETNIQSQKFENELNQLSMELVAKNTEINRLQQSLKQKSQTIDQSDMSMDRTAAEAMAAWAESYQQQEINFQEQLAAARIEYEGTMQQKLENSSDRFETQIAALKRQIGIAESQTTTQTDKYASEVSELSTKLQQMEERNKELEDSVTELLEKSDTLAKELTEQRIQNDQLQREFEEAKSREPTISLTDIQKATSKLKNMNEFIDSILQLSNFSMITILLRMDGKMSLEHLAKSVGMDPLVLENQLQPLHQRDLIDIRRDGQIVANIPTNLWFRTN